MNKLAIILVACVLNLSAVQRGQTTRAGKNGKPKIVSFSSSLNTVVWCEDPGRFAPCPAKEVTLRVAAMDPDGDRLRYRYEVTGGKIVGRGQTAQWNLEDVANGRFQARVTVTDRRGGEDKASITVMVVDGPHSELLAPPCPSDPVKVTCPSGLDVNRRAVFSAIITAGESPKTVTYYWTVNWGKIISGQGTRRIEVEHKEKWGEKLTATVHLGGYDPSCFAQASCSVALE